MQLQTIARIYTDFDEKFGIPRQSGIVKDLIGKIVFEEHMRDPEMLKGLEDFDYLWLIWHFSEVPEGRWSSTVRPPRLGGNVRKGVFATRSPFRPNPLGLSSVKIERIEYHSPEGPVIYVSGVDMLNGTPIFDIKPYVAYADSHPEAASGFAVKPEEKRLEVQLDERLAEMISEDKREALTLVLSLDPRPAYQEDPDREYGMSFSGRNIKFKVDGQKLTVISIE